MGAPFPSSTGPCSPKSFCSLRIDALPKDLAKSAEELVQRADRILTRNILCRHTPEQLSLLHTKLERLGREGRLTFNERTLSLILVERVQGAIRALLTLPEDQASSRDLINLYYLSQFSPIVPTDSFNINTILQKRRARGAISHPRRSRNSSPTAYRRSIF